MFSEDPRFVEWNQQGLIPGPDEGEESFIQRAEYSTNLKENLGREVPLEFGDLDTKGILQEAYPTTQRLFDISPRWIPLFFSNHKLAPWHGGCAWIYQLGEDTPTTAFLQLRRAFRTTSHYLGIYERKELIAHEIAHVGRMVFEEPKFEEFFAYKTSDSWFRSYFGPIVQSAWESAIFLLVLLATVLLDFFLLSSGHPDAIDYVLWNKSIPIGLLFYSLVRLWWRHRQFSRCYAHLRKVCNDEQKAAAIMYRLTDHEITTFSASSSLQINSYFAEQAPQSLRLKLIKSIYLS